MDYASIVRSAAQRMDLVNDQGVLLNMDSLAIVELVIAIEKATKLKIPATALRPEVFATVSSVVEMLNATARGGAPDDLSAEGELADFVAALSDLEVTAQLADWSRVRLDVKTSASSARFTGPRTELFDRLVAQHRIDAHPSSPLARRDSSTAPVTFDQQVDWDFHERGNWPTLGVQAFAFSLRGALDVPALQRAVAALVERQAALRSTFARDGEKLIQTVHTHPFALELVDMAGMEPSTRREHARKRFAAISTPHDLGREVFRAELLELSADDHLLFVVPHHIVVDGFGWNVLQLELTALYRAFATGGEPALAPLEFEFADFCFWQRSLEERPVGRKQLAYWASAIANYEDLELPCDGRAVARGAVGGAVDTYPMAATPFALDGEPWSLVEQTASRFGCTPFTVIGTGFLLLLARWAGREDVCALSSNFHRNRPGSDAVVGNFVTPYPLRVSFDADGTLEQALRRCHETILANREHQHVAPAIARWTEWSRYSLNYLIIPTKTQIDLGAVTFEALDWNELESRTPQDLGLFVRQLTHGVRGELRYNADRFSQELAARAAECLGPIITAICADPSRRIRDLPKP